jgi:hypothetical protein
VFRLHEGHRGARGDNAIFNHADDEINRWARAFYLRVPRSKFRVFGQGGVGCGQDIGNTKYGLRLGFCSSVGGEPPPDRCKRMLLETLAMFSLAFAAAPRDAHLFASSFRLQTTCSETGTRKAQRGTPHASPARPEARIRGDW